jgi:hypothetical protein
VLDYVIADFLWARAVLLLGPTPATLGLSVQVPIATALDVVLGRPAWLAGPRPAALTLGGSALILGGFAAITLAGAAPRGSSGGVGGDLAADVGAEEPEARAERGGTGAAAAAEATAEGAARPGLAQ